MDGHHDDEAGDDALSEEGIAVENRLREAEQTRQQFEQAEWQWRDQNGYKFLCHPDDSDICIWFHPSTGHQHLSPKFVEHLKEAAKADPDRWCT